MSLSPTTTESILADFAENINESFSVRFFLVGERLDLRTLERAECLALNPMTLKVTGGGIAVLFRYGMIVLFNVSPLEEHAFLASLKPFIIQPLAQIEQESEVVYVRPDTTKEGMIGNNVTLAKITLERLQLIADIFSKNLILSHYEAEVAKHFDYIEPLAMELKMKGRGGRQVRELLNHIGGVLLSEHKMVGRVATTEKPETLWDHPELERFYLALEDEYEIHDRQIALERKLDLLARTLETALELIHNQHSHRLEWYIIILIIMEVIISIIELVSKH